MNRLSIVFTIGCLAAVAAMADVVTLRNGQTVYGTYIGGTARQIQMDIRGQIQTFDISQIQSISFTDAGSPQSTYGQNPQGGGYNQGAYNQSGPQGAYNPGAAYGGASSQSQAPNPSPAAYPPSAPPAPGPVAGGMGITLPADTPVTVRMIDSVDSETARLGQTFKASLDEPLTANGQVIAPRGADVLTKLVDDQQAGKIQGRTVLKLALMNISINGRPVDVTSTDVTQESASRGSRSAKVIGGTAALGTIIGALGGGGKGAAIGAVSGAAAGGAVQVLTSGQKVKIPSETRLTFRLQNPVQI